MLGFRHSTSRDAYVLRVVGNRFGPVYQMRIPPRNTTSTIVEPMVGAEPMVERERIIADGRASPKAASEQTPVAG